MDFKYLVNSIKNEDLSPGIDLSRLPAPKAIEEISYEAILSEMKASFIKKMRNIDSNYQLYETDPAAKILEVAARRELGLRAKINDAIKDCMLAYADGSNLEQIAALFQVTRESIGAGKESDQSLRNRALMSFDRFSTAGASAGYIYQAKKVGTRLDLYDVKAYTKPDEPGNHIFVSLLYKDHSKLVDEETGKPKKEIIEAHLKSDSVKPLTDVVFVEDAEPIFFEPKATLYVASNNAAEDIILNKAVEGIKAYAADCYRIGADISLAGLYSALSVPGVWDISLTGMSENRTILNNQVAVLVIKKENFSVEVKER